ncbi:MAG: hypothetical protein RBS37_11075, partial [Bacteroidales bacterium]|nr:hypothetical protein [Bacteroidales bacterium]
MKKLIITSVLALLLAGGGAVTAQDYPQEYLGLPGDNLNLYAVMNLFQESETLEAFESSINDENSRINNLDLNGDNLVDYIMVSDFVDGDVHNIVLRVAMNSRDFQDVAVFTVQKFSNGAVQIQLIGDEALYGKDYIIEPVYNETPNPGYTGRSSGAQRVVVAGTTYYEVATWPVIRYIYHPTYVVWRSSWYWGYWPVYWNPWRPYYWHFYYGYHYNWYPHYYGRYRHWHVYRYPGYRDYYYTSIRVYSPVVVININNGSYRDTYSRPEYRRTGEEFYANVHRSQGSTSVSNSNAVNQSRRASVPESVRVQSATASSTQRRNTGTVSTNSGSANNAQNRNASGQVANESRRSASTVTGNTGSSSAGGTRTSATAGNTEQRRVSATTSVSNGSNAVQRSGNTVNVSSGSNASDRRANSSVQSGTAVQRSSSGTATQRSSSAASVNSSTVRSSTSTQRSSGAAVQRSSASTQRSSGAAVQRSSASTQRSSGAAVQRSSTSTQRSSGAAVQRSSSSTQRSSGAAVQRSSSSTQRRSGSS